MAKLKTPLFSFEAHKSLGGAITFQSGGGRKFAREKPVPTDPYSLKQAYQRWEYQDYAAWWNAQSVATKQQWETDARPYHMTGFAYWMRARLTDLQDLAARYRLDAVSGGLTPDSSKNTNTGTVIGASPALGLIDRCLHFDGINDWVDCGSGSSIQLTAPLTLEAFINPTNYPSFHGIIGKGNGAANGYFFFRLGEFLNYQGQLIFGFWNGATHPEIQGSSIPKDTWTHVAATYDGAFMRLYINGQLDKEQAEVSAMTTGQSLKIGRTHGARYFDGLIDHAILTNRALPESDIKRHSERRYPLP